MEEWTAQRRINAERIWSAARGIPGLRVPVVPEGVEHAAYKGYVFVEPGALQEGWDRDRVLVEINKRGVPCEGGSCPEIYLEKALDNTGWRPAERLPIARELGDTSVMFLVHPTLRDEHIKKMILVLGQVLHEAV